MTVYIYGLYDARTPDLVRYVGQTADLSARMSAHLGGRDQATAAWVEQTKTERSEVRWKILKESTPERANLDELKFIQAFPNLINRDYLPKHNPTKRKQYARRAALIMPLDHMIILYCKWAFDRLGKSPTHTARALQVSPATVRNWLKKFEAVRPRRPGFMMGEIKLGPPFEQISE